MNDTAILESLTNALSKVEGDNLAQKLESVKVNGGDKLESMAGPTTFDELIAIARQVPPGTLAQEVAAALAKIELNPVLREQVVQVVPFLGVAVAFLGLAKRHSAPLND